MTPGIGAELHLPEAVAKAGVDRVRAFGGRVVAIHPGSGSPRKNWPLERFIETAKTLKAKGTVQPVFLLGEAERDMVAMLVERCPECPLITGLDIVELASDLRACVAYLGNDSGVTHLAAAVGVPVLDLFGPTDPAIWAPRGARVRVVPSDAATPAVLALALST